MPPLIPEFSWQTVFLDPWGPGAAASSGWVVLMGFFAGSACGLVGVYLILRRMALVGDAISHSVLPGIAAGFLLAGTRSTWVMFTGALAAAVVTTSLIEFIHRRTRVKQDAAIGVTFSTLFAIGVLMITLFAHRVDLDQDCVLYGDMTHVGISDVVVAAGIPLAPPAVLRMGGVMAATLVLIGLFYKELLVTSFDSALSRSLGIRPGWVHHGLMAWLAVVVVSSFEAAGAILVIAMLIVPGATMLLHTHRLPWILAGTVIQSAVSSVAGFHLAVWLECSVAAAMVVAGGGLFLAAWLLHLAAGWRRRLSAPEPGEQRGEEQAG